jgi:hypothetical protein
MFEMAITTLAWQGCGPAGMTPAVGTKRGTAHAGRRRALPNSGRPIANGGSMGKVYRMEQSVRKPADLTER